MAITYIITSPILNGRHDKFVNEIIINNILNGSNNLAYEMSFDLSYFLDIIKFVIKYIVAIPRAINSFSSKLNI